MARASWLGLDISITFGRGVCPRLDCRVSQVVVPWFMPRRTRETQSRRVPGDPPTWSPRPGTVPWGRSVFMAPIRDVEPARRQPSDSALLFWSRCKHSTEYACERSLKGRAQPRQARHAVHASGRTICLSLLLPTNVVYNTHCPTSIETHAHTPV